MLPYQARENLNPTFSFLGLRHLSCFRAGEPSPVTTPLSVSAKSGFFLRYGGGVGAGLEQGKEP